MQQALWGQDLAVVAHGSELSVYSLQQREPQRVIPQPEQVMQIALGWAPGGWEGDASTNAEEFQIEELLVGRPSIPCRTGAAICVARPPAGFFTAQYKQRKLLTFGSYFDRLKSRKFQHQSSYGL